MADDATVTTEGMDEFDSVTDDELEEVANLEEESNPVLDQERETVEEEEYSEPLSARGAHHDSGEVDEETWMIDEVERGAGINLGDDEEEVAGFHIEDPSSKIDDVIESDDSTF
jgi:hypothetical protein